MAVWLCCSWLTHAAPFSFLGELWGLVWGHCPIFAAFERRGSLFWTTSKGICGPHFENLPWNQKSQNLKLRLWTILSLSQMPPQHDETVSTHALKIRSKTTFQNQVWTWTGLLYAERSKYLGISPRSGAHWRAHLAVAFYDENVFFYFTTEPYGNPDLCQCFAADHPDDPSCVPYKPWRMWGKHGCR